MRTSIFKGLNLILAAVEGDSLMPKLRIDFLHRSHHHSWIDFSWTVRRDWCWKGRNIKLLTRYLWFCVASSIIWSGIWSLQKRLQFQWCALHWSVLLGKLVADKDRQGRNERHLVQGGESLKTWWANCSLLSGHPVYAQWTFICRTIWWSTTKALNIY